MPPSLRTSSEGLSSRSSSPLEASYNLLFRESPASRPSWLRRRWRLLMGVGLCAMFICLQLGQLSQSQVHIPVANTAAKKSQYPVPSLQGSVTAPGVGFVFVAMGTYARQLKCEAAIESLRKNAGWAGPIYVITDAPKCFDHERWGGCGLNATIVSVPDVHLSDSFAWPDLNASGTKGNRLLSKSYKMRIFELIPDPAIEILIFLDSDILSANAPDGCLSEFISQYATPAAFSGKTTIYIYPENNPTKINGIVHSGGFVVHREASAGILKAWRDQVLSGEDASDQAAFIRAGIDSYVFIDEPKYLYRPRCDREACASDTSLLKCFTHLNYARCFKQGRDTIQDLVDRWDLCTMQGVKYCHPLYMEPFAKTWLPYHSCKKIEFGAFR